MLDVAGKFPCPTAFASSFLATNKELAKSERF
jgi:hypothetical protein